MDDSVFLPGAATAAAALAPTSVPIPVLNNASAWHNFTLWTAQHLGYAFNVTKLAPSLEDLVWAGPRMVKKLGKLGGSYIFYPDAIDGFGQRVIAESTDPAAFFVTTTPDSTTAADAARAILESASSSAAATATGQESAAFASRFTMEGARGLGSVFSYATSKWALACIVMAVVFNRTHIFAATRRRLALRWTVRLALRLPVILVLAWQVERILESIQCQTSPDFANLRWGNASKSSDLMFSEKNNFLHGLSSTLLFGATDKQSCQAIRMVPWDNNSNEQPELVGSLSRLWPLFMTFCVSQFIEVLSATVQGRPVAAETGMTLFEHSLAFAEADAAISNQLGWGLFTGKGNSSQALTGSAVAVTRSMILRRVNTSPEVLLVAFLSAMSHLTSQILGVFNLQSKFRLINTGFWGLCFMGSIVWGAVTFSIEDSSAQALLRFPTVCIIGFVPHVLIICGIFICSVIYALTMALSAFAVTEGALDAGQQRPTLRDRLARAHANMQANGSLSDIRIRWDMDFYTALLRAGFGAITMASEAVYLNEDHRVNVKRYTWLEDERFREIEELRMQWLGGGVSGSRFDSVGVIGLVPVKEDQANATSGYARERAAQKIPRNSVSARRLRDGVGASERSGRWLLAIEYVMHISRLIITTSMLVIIKLLSYFGIRNPPRWLRALALQPPKPETTTTGRRSGRRGDRGTTAIWVDASDPNSFPVPRSERVDVEAEFRRRLQQPLGSEQPDASEADIDSKLYSWFLNGGWWGNTDTSGDYVPPDGGSGLDDPDFDTTSIISTTESTSLSDLDAWESDSDNNHLQDGQRTPTQSSPYPNNNSDQNPLQQSWAFSRESTPSQVADLPLAASDLARLLNPQSPEERDEAITLAAHLSFEEGIMTRSRFRQHQARQRVKVLLSGAQHRSLYGYGRGQSTQMMTPEEEARRLEQILLSRRATAAPTEAGDEGSGSGNGSNGAAATAGDWATGADGLGSEGPQCVVCQCAPRTIIVWPCRCLSLCDECRVSLAMNNFDKCVCCRREVISFSRIYVP
ncbi:hypothetical protein NEUTE1DRAFT_121325 [Neurospora tetrasperma FGSC 2508]|uniref:RING-type domain-containing protein n=1 Tax=Neurospora tetrasperma (strain FGSC 2508 / ATCC MYA-4615 / P0657) TaxID=510951 RepID=F8MH19_NEUT8|nr:uncharacterized protein NEUTE1DRAFT_121325 [Neurospora tetrasperma FGSC 2508]EGO59535.1 hypothetical protein NEUTE1DRAFT_121325 [Neurospora tetrasperma FGSC 2508]EGZ73666.1 hypothetical protein NEUTE2DRAFT_87106 [Neurospora tetrasperma FGSC 2509]